jgi:hypothetical protein
MQTQPLVHFRSNARDSTCRIAARRPLSGRTFSLVRRTSGGCPHRLSHNSFSARASEARGDVSRETSDSNPASRHEQHGLRCDPSLRASYPLVVLRTISAVLVRESNPQLIDREFLLNPARGGTRHRIRPGRAQCPPISPQTPHYAHVNTNLPREDSTATRRDKLPAQMFHVKQIRSPERRGEALGLELSNPGHDTRKCVTFRTAPLKPLPWVEAPESYSDVSRETCRRELEIGDPMNLEPQSRRLQPNSATVLRPREPRNRDSRLKAPAAPRLRLLIGRSMRRG